MMHSNTVAQVAVAMVMALPAFALPVGSGQATLAGLSPRNSPNCTYDKNGKPIKCTYISVIKPVSAGTIWLPGRPSTKPFDLPTGGDGSMYRKRDSKPPPCVFDKNDRLASKGPCSFTVKPKNPQVLAGTIWLPGRPVTNPFKLGTTGGDGSMYGKRDNAAEEAAEAEGAEEDAEALAVSSGQATPAGLSADSKHGKRDVSAGSKHGKRSDAAEKAAVVEEAEEGADLE
ncbi:hypothetical protein MAPG_04491 [Magnaporthiopsis poae ATCC 64411]|uniref:Uncharacterized protein n=1 Tax=Magnaporthiopsis poae (strain ATCC 64411 / 73-15) TaxID=644358 RepID=A0A0C4DWV8_MAGP6|nr:hypothetical protein MAPG_04491 [Magnaporthiopsis poae ATCC 64411]